MKNTNLYNVKIKNICQNKGINILFLHPHSLLLDPIEEF